MTPSGIEPATFRSPSANRTPTCSIHCHLSEHCKSARIHRDHKSPPSVLSWTRPDPFQANQRHIFKFHFDILNPFMLSSSNRFHSLQFYSQNSASFIFPPKRATFPSHPTLLASSCMTKKPKISCPTKELWWINWRSYTIIYPVRYQSLPIVSANSVLASQSS